MKKIFINNIIITLSLLILSMKIVASTPVDTGEDNFMSGFQNPPAKKLEYRGEAPSKDHAWLDGYWNWEKKQWVWHKGRYQHIIKDRPPINNPEYIPPPPSHLHVWVPGKWTIEEGDWLWLKGRYITRPFTNAHWKPGHWRRYASGWVWVEGHW